MRSRFPISAIAAVLVICVTGVALLACTPTTNSNGTPTNAAEQAAGALLTTYAAADTAYLAYLTAGTPSPVVIRAVEPYRLAASKALQDFGRAAVAGNAAALQSAAVSAVAAFSGVLVGNGIKVGS